MPDYSDSGQDRGAKYYTEEKTHEQPEQRELPSFHQLFADLPLSGCIASNAWHHDGVIYFSALDSYIYAVKAGTGELVWKFKTGAPVLSTPLVHNGLVYFGSNDEHFYCTDLNGILVWKKYTGGIIPSSPLGIGDRIIIPNGAGYVICFSTEGDELWRFRGGEGINSNPTAVNDTIFVGCYDKNFYALALDGRLKWKYATGARTTTPSVMANNRLLCDPNRRSWDKVPRAENPTIYCSSYDNNVYAFKEDGTVVWKFNCGTSPAGGLGASEGTIYAGAITGLFFAIDAINGREKWRFKTGGMIASGAETKDNKVLFTSLDQKLYCLSSDGEKLWDFMTGGPMTSRPFIINDKVFFGSSDTFFYCIDINKRNVEWTFQVGFGLPESIKPVISSISNAFIEYDRKIFRIWVPETAKKSFAPINTANYIAKLGIGKDFVYGGTNVYSTSGKKKNDPYRFGTGF